MVTQTGAGDPIAAELSVAGFADAEAIGRGGFGVVYRCRQVPLQRLVAVKVLKDLDGNRARFVREQQAMARLTGHPNIVPVLQVGETASGHPFLVMPFCGLGCIQQRIRRLGVLEAAEALRLGVKMAGALASAHHFEILHRDVKPANILLSDFGEPALGDFGIAHMTGAYRTATGVLTGSPAFLAPELLAGDPPSMASDVYGLGMTLFAALTGHAAFERRNDEQVVAQLLRIATDRLPDLREHGIPEGVAGVVDSATAHDPADRPSALELGELIRQVQSHLGLPVDEMALQHDRASDRRPKCTVTSASVSSGGGRLPSKVASFVGRDAEATHLQELFWSSRLVTLTGVGGVGKTTLAAHSAAKLHQQFTDGVWWVGLSELSEGTLLTEVVAAALGVREQLGRAPIEALVDFLAQRQALVVLDDCEHLIADVASLAEALLRDCPQLRILATSREVLDIEGEAVLRLDPLSCPAVDDDPPLRTLAGYESVQLFVQRARAVAPGFELDDHNATSIARICARLEGLPLAIELAAARMRAMSAKQIAEELSDRYTLLTHGHRGARTRQQSLAACVNWSYELCTPSEQRLWCRLSVLGESFDLPTARGICGEDMPAGEFLDLLCALVDKSILIRTEHHGVACFRLLEILRDYGKARATEAERIRLSRRHAQWYHQLLAEAEAQWFGPQQLQWILRLTREMPNIREALQFSLTDCPAMAADMTTALRRFWIHHATLSEGSQWASRALAAIPAEPSLQRIRPLFTAAYLTLRHGDLVTGAGWLAEVRQLLEVVDDPVTRGGINFTDGYAALLTGDMDHAREGLQRAMAATDDFEVQAYAMAAMSWVELISGDAHAALGWSDKCLALAESRGGLAIRGVAVGSVGVAQWQLGHLRRAERALQQSVQFALETDDRCALANGLEVLAWITESRQRPRQAAVLMAAAAEMSRASGAPLSCSCFGGFHAECERRVREQLGEAEFQAAWNDGTALNITDVAQAIPQACASERWSLEHREPWSLELELRQWS
ncbi:protein kinase [Mycobacterium shinjukuense]|nr:protein kinase [Mycobacterium shinjukuense]